jgi:uncharacterized BrkB/YihY/UPF0761 family membrane protein
VKALVIIVFAALYLLVTFFGLGPVLLADGTREERIYTFLIVLLIYVVLTVIFRYLLKRLK